MDFGAVITAMVTPFDKDRAVNYRKARELADMLVQEGSDGVLVAGTTGESPTLTGEEKLDLFRQIKDVVKGRGTLIAGTGSNSTEATIRLTAAAREIGVDGALVVCPYYNKPPQEGIYQHYEAVAGAVDLPIIVYNIPGRTGVNITPETLERLAGIRNIVAVKESSGNLDQVSEVIRRAGVRRTSLEHAMAGAPVKAAGHAAGQESTSSRMYVYSGDDSLTLPILSVGGVGVVSVLSHIAGQKVKRMIEAFFEGRHDEATEIHLHLLAVTKALFMTSNPIMVKAALEMRGFPAGPPRPPLVEATPIEKEKMRAVMKESGLLSP
jgi:4-hydroxy-tetrahydrodipicolinate synthase